MGATSKVIELQSAILEAQSSIFSANEERAALIQTVGNLKKQIADLETWDSEKAAYQLAELGPGAFAYLFTDPKKTGSPLHALCANCYQNRKKSLLQHELRAYGMSDFVCHACSSKLSVDIGNPKFPFKDFPKWEASV